MKDKPLALLVIDNLERLPFFLRVADNLTNFKVLFVVYKASVAFRLKVMGISNFRYVNVNYKAPQQSIYNDAFEVKVGLLTVSDINKIAYGVQSFVKKIIADLNHDISFVMVWNGNFIHERAFCDALPEKIPVIYFELANIDGKLQMDNQGVNAASTLYSTPSIVEDLPEASEEYFVWKEKYLERKLGSHQVKQSKNKRKLNLWTALDVSYDLIIGKPLLEVNYFKKINTFLKNRKGQKNFIQQSYGKNNYCFFPMQVKNDTQCILNSDYSVIQALEKAYEIASSENLKLVVKPHPAEIDANFIEQIIDEYQDRVFFSNDNTFRLIKDAKKIITINSSVGIEAKLMDKDVYTLGRSFYSNLSNKQLDKVIDNYFVNIDYFSSDPITVGYLEKIIREREYINLS